MLHQWHQVILQPGFERYIANPVTLWTMGSLGTMHNLERRTASNERALAKLVFPRFRACHNHPKTDLLELAETSPLTVDDTRKMRPAHREAQSSRESPELFPQTLFYVDEGTRDFINPDKVRYPFPCSEYLSLPTPCVCWYYNNQPVRAELKHMVKRSSYSMHNKPRDLAISM